jgi:hypothetical protein
MDRWAAREKLGERATWDKAKICPCFFFKKFFRVSEIRGKGDIQIQDSKGTRVCMGGRMSPIISDVLMFCFSFLRCNDKNRLDCLIINFTNSFFTQ